MNERNVGGIPTFVQNETQSKTMGSNQSTPAANQLLITREQLDLYERNYDTIRDQLTEKSMESERLTKEVSALREALNAERLTKDSFSEVAATLRDLNRRVREATARLAAGDLELERAKRENAALYVRVGERPPEATLAELRNLEEVISEWKSGLEGEVEAVRRKMDRATERFSSRVERAVAEVREAAAEAERGLGEVERQLGKGDRRLVYEKAKNVLLRQKNWLMERGGEKGLLGNLDLPKALNIEKKLDNSMANLNLPNENNKIVIHFVPETDDDLATAKSILKHLTNRNLDEIDVYRMGKEGDEMRPLTIIVNDSISRGEIMTNRFSLKDTEFRGLKVVKYDKEYKNKSESNKTDDSDKRDNPIGDRRYKVLFKFVPEGGDDLQKARGILRELTTEALGQVNVRRIGYPAEKKIRPMVVSFDNERILKAALKNRCTLKDTKFKGTRVLEFQDQKSSTYKTNVGDEDNIFS